MNTSILPYLKYVSQERENCLINFKLKIFSIFNTRYMMEMFISENVMLNWIEVGGPDLRPEPYDKR